MPTSAEIRTQFLDFFKGKDHTHVPSSLVVPVGDPTLLFANAGMNQFKDVFLGTGTRDYRRAANTQKCIRAGGKHNDLEDVGRDTYHHTFFEMLGNWSFGDYFKAEAIEWAWELLTGQWKLDPSRLHATVFGGDPQDGLEPDHEAAELWRKLTDIPPEHIHFFGRKDNFWEMGDTGPCGPCSEIHYDNTPNRSGHGLVNADDPRVIEIWNLVFIQFNRDATGKLRPLPARHVDTGMGFERITAVLQGKSSNYDTDVFTPIFAEIQRITGAPPYSGAMDQSEAGKRDTAYRVIADHIRTLTMALTDGGHCGNEGRDYVLRRILRRAVHFGANTLGVDQPFFHELVPAVVRSLGDAFPELKKNPQAVADELREEETAFRRTLDRGTQLFLQIAGRGDKTISGDDAFTLFDTHGFPLDLTQVMAQDRGMTVDVAGFQARMEQARALSRSASGREDLTPILVELMQKESLLATGFEGYSTTELNKKMSVRLFVIEGDHCREVSKAQVDERVIAVAPQTVFYAESGGQVGDTGVIEAGHGKARLRVIDTRKLGDVWFHIADVQAGPVDAGERTWHLSVDAPRRAAIMSHHTTTHLMNRALRLHVHAGADQKGSLVDEFKTRFDFSCPAPVSPEQVQAVEKQVNDDIAADLKVYWAQAPQEEALRINGLRAVFGEKYPPSVRVVSIGVPVENLLAEPDREQWSGYSIEFCGGTHLDKTGDAEGFVIINEEGVAKGIRRLTALAGSAAHRATVEASGLQARIDALGTSGGADLPTQVMEIQKLIAERELPLIARWKLRDSLAALQQKIKELDKQKSRQAAGDIVEQARALADSANDGFLIECIEGADPNLLRTAMDVIRSKKPGLPLLLVGVMPDKLAFLASVPPEYIKQGWKAGDWVRQVAQAAGGGGGGRPDMAQAGGRDPEKLPEALSAANDFARSRLT
ncbi:MAG: alanine--tRNA ligase [Phycisphaeraceae bacterium]|nr:alanine--tRNA ligase [Phycisphaeraceae bacterium]